MKFPVEIVRIIGKVKRYKESEDYLSIYKLKGEMLKNFEALKEDIVFNELVKSAFYLKIYDEAILLGEELLKRGYESHEELYYVLLSTLASNDIYHAFSIIKRSKVITHPANEQYLISDGANYSNLLRISYKTPSVLLLFIIVNLINGSIVEANLGIEITLEYIFGRMLELIDQLYELGYHNDIISELTEKVKMIFLE